MWHVVFILLFITALATEDDDRPEWAENTVQSKRHAMVLQVRRQTIERLKNGRHAKEDAEQKAESVLQALQSRMRIKRATNSPTGIPTPMPTTQPTETPTTVEQSGDDDQILNGNSREDYPLGDVLHHRYTHSKEGRTEVGNRKCKQACCSKIVPLFSPKLIVQVFPLSFPSQLSHDCRPSLHRSLFFKGGNPCSHVEVGGDLNVLKGHSALFNLLASFCVCFRASCDHQPVEIYGATAAPTPAPLPHKLRSPTSDKEPILEMPASWKWSESATSRQVHLKAALHRCLLPPRPKWCP
jgi:hypothetical protein